MQCPVCQTPVSRTKDAPHRPFCSERCRWVDLSKWLDGDYVIAGRRIGDGWDGLRALDSEEPG